MTHLNGGDELLMARVECGRDDGEGSMEAEMSSKSEASRSSDPMPRSSSPFRLACKVPWARAGRSSGVGQRGAICARTHLNYIELPMRQGKGGKRQGKHLFDVGPRVTMKALAQYWSSETDRFLVHYHVASVCRL